MKINSIVNRYIFKEMIPPFVINMAFFTFVFLMARILDITKLIVNYKIGIFNLLLMLIYTTPFYLIFITPMSVMIAVLLTFLGMSSNNEIIALKTGGVSIYRLLPPVLLFCLIGWFISSFMSIYGLPYGRLASKKLIHRVISSNVNIGLKERTFNDDFKGVMIYANKIDLKNHTLLDIFIEDKRVNNIISTVVAPKGKLFSDPDNFSFQLLLFDGIINQVDLNSRSVYSVSFDTYSMSLGMKRSASVTKKGHKDEEEMSLSELRQYLKNTLKKDQKYYISLTEYHRKFSVPFASFALGILAVPLGVKLRSTKRSFGLVLGLIFFLVYYFLLSAGWVFGESGIYPPLIGMWMPNVVLGSIGLFFLIRTAKERPLMFDSSIHWITRYVSRFTKKKDNR